MEKIFHVFVSSTYNDLKNERKKVSESVAKAGFVPEGMEIFPASSQNQMDFIQRVIDRCDYYILIIGRRYGSIAPDGLSYTEKEYLYAKSKNIPVLAFLSEDNEGNDEGSSEEDNEKKEKLDQFKNTLTSETLVDFWTNTDELATKALAALSQAKISHPGIGWIRANRVANSEILSEINELRKANSSLVSIIESQKTSNDLLDDMELASLDEEFKIDFKFLQNTKNNAQVSITMRWRDILSAIGPTFRTYTSINEAYSILAEMISGKYNHQYNASIIDVKKISLETIFYQFEALGLMQLMEHDLKLTSIGNSYKLTDKGVKTLMKVKVIATATSN